MLASQLHRCQDIFETLADHYCNWPVVFIKVHVDLRGVALIALGCDGRGSIEDGEEYRYSPSLLTLGSKLNQGVE
jgi:hypothetical protein